MQISGFKEETQSKNLPVTKNKIYFVMQIEII